ncbi:MAG: aldehyde:ferredoxin oxidoreductase [Deltaproteobacteria bacterium]|nr:aldehyde:ferredoxin oxidoreductase [Deltaproteobacteria bacterium]
MKGGYTGKIARVNLTDRSVSTLPTEKYLAFGGGHGIGSAIFFDLVGDQLPFDAFDPRNLIMMIASPFSGTFMPGSGRVDVQGLSPMLYPIEWFGHSNFGGRFTAQLKFAGWDGVVVEGAADKPCWINIINDKVVIEDANGIWGMDTWDTQQEIARRVMPSLRHGEWAEVSDDDYSTQVPAVVCCGPAGETKSRLGCLLQGPGSQAALCGFGGVFGSKNLKAISAIGTGSVPIADPKAFMDARLWFNKFQWNVDNPREGNRFLSGMYRVSAGAPSGANTTNGTVPLVPARAAACASCPRGCRMRTASSDSNESVCGGTMTFGTLGASGDQKKTRRNNDLMQKYGFGHWQLIPTKNYLKNLYDRGLVGKGKMIECDLPLDQWDSESFPDMLMEAMASRKGIGNDLAEGAARFAKKYGLLEEDLHKGVLPLTYWGTSDHYDARIEVEWGYGSLLGERDLMLHMMSDYPLHWMAWTGDPFLTAEQAARLYTDAMAPYNGDIFMADYSEERMYSESKVKSVAWVKHYEKFWIGAGGFCGWRWPMCITCTTEDRRGPTPEAEPKFWNAVTGQNLSFADGMEIGHKIYTLDRAIWVLQGRHRDMEVFPDYIYDQPSRGSEMPMYINGEWNYVNGAGRKVDRKKFEDWKTKFYKFEGYNPENGYPTRKTLEGMGLKNVADLLKKRGKLG